ncbi:kinesin-like protein KIN-6 isoform X2 [Lotus japonicus]|uniref:kinesin-like protein KIN-6 isoform X2 n=1 Tax=Lotus japonicus TaxID=34305 RepID=UPI0025908D07|nr:kinesin-like protein KIN-6 isoform X2 [Lotus japonicus]
MDDPNASPHTVTGRNPRREASDEVAPLPHEAQTPSTSQEKESLNVFLRIRPIPILSQALRARPKVAPAWPKKPMRKNIPRPKKKSTAVCLSVQDSQSVTLSTPSSLQVSKRIESVTYGGFSHVFSSDSSQSLVYDRMVRPMVDEFLKGRSGMLAALGPSGSGKTHTVFGTPRDPGMVPLALRHIFNETEPSRSYYLSIFEIYTERGKTEKLLDLFPNGNELSMHQSTVNGLQEVLISNAEQADSLITKAMLKRATAMTNTNSQSSRSQCIISIHDVPQKCKGVVNSKSNGAVLTIIDLAGSEREKRTGNQGTRLLESNFINNTLMVFGLCLRSLLEHQKNPKKPLQKHFQSSMLTRYLRDYLEVRKRMALILTAKSGEDDYLDTSYLLRQSSPYMEIRYNVVEAPNMVPSKRHYQASIMDNVDPSPSSEQKRVRVVSQHTVQNEKKDVEECNTYKEDASTVCKLDACDDSERCHTIFKNFAKVIWSCLKQNNSKLKAVEREYEKVKESLQAVEKEYEKVKESLEDEKKKNIELENRLIELKKTMHTKSSSDNILDQLDELTLVTSCIEEVDPDSEKWEVSISSSSKPEHNEASKKTMHAKSSSDNILDQLDELTLGTSCIEEVDPDSEKWEVSISSSSKPEHNEASKVDTATSDPVLQLRRPTKKWSEVEVATFLSAVEKFGPGQWKLIENFHKSTFKDRTNKDLKDKWRNLTKCRKKKA